MRYCRLIKGDQILRIGVVSSTWFSAHCVNPEGPHIPLFNLPQQKLPRLRAGTNSCAVSKIPHAPCGYTSRPRHLSANGPTATGRIPTTLEWLRQWRLVVHRLVSVERAPDSLNAQNPNSSRVELGIGLRGYHSWVEPQERKGRWNRWSANLFVASAIRAAKSAMATGCTNRLVPHNKLEWED